MRFYFDLAIRVGCTVFAAAVFVFAVVRMWQSPHVDSVIIWLAVAMVFLRETSASSMRVFDHVQPVLLDRRLFQLDEDAFEKFSAALDAPPVDNARLRKLLSTRAPWEK